MSGIFPGTRPKHVWQVLVDSLAPSEEASKHLDTQWAQLRWYETVAEPGVNGPTNEPTTQLRIDEPAAEEPTTLAFFLRIQGGEWQSEPLIALSWPIAEREGVAVVDGALIDALGARLAAAGWRLRACATCAHWWPSAESGRCTWRAADADAAHNAGNAGNDDAVQGSEGYADGGHSTEPLTTQAPLALACTHWRPAAERESPIRPTAGLPAVRSVRRPLWRRLLPRLVNRRVADGSGWRAQVMERLTGPGSISAGTEPCAICRGRSVNLGARSGQSAEGDAETWSVWRCNRCHTFYANHWIDRWVRLDSLETEETLVRVAPSEALALLQQILEPAGDSGWVAAFRQLFASRPPLAHQIKHGR